jgi:peptidoglycan/xylan/chitin deacetylase (PgdA/CDA1 family)
MMLRVLTYHRVAEPEAAPHLHPGLISATPTSFERQVRYLATNYEVVSMEQVLDAWKANHPLPSRAVLLTFDDGYRDFADVAWPILKDHRLPVTLFVATAYPGRPQMGFWWDRLYQAFISTTRNEPCQTPVGALSLASPSVCRTSLRRIEDYVKGLPHDAAMAFVDNISHELGGKQPEATAVLDWEQLRALSQQGVVLGAHTRTHARLTHLPPEKAAEEIQGSQQDLRREIGSVLPVFCYPDGAHNDSVVEMVREGGFELAFTTRDGQNKPHSADPLRLRRTNITPRTSLPIFRLRLQRWVSYLDGWRHRKQSWAASA